MKALGILGLYFLGVILLMHALSCRIGKDLPEAEISVLTLVSKDSVDRDGKTKYVYKWFSRSDGLTYVVYTYADYIVEPGDIIRGLIRK